MWQLSEIEDIWHCCEELYSISCQPLRVTACQGGLTSLPPIWDCRALSLQEETLSSVKVHLSPDFLFIFYACHPFLCVYLHAYLITLHLSKKCPISFWVLIVSVNTGNIFCFTSFSRHVNLALGKVPQRVENEWHNAENGPAYISIY